MSPTYPSLKDVEITAIGNKRLIAPAGQSWDEWFNGPGVSSDFMTERTQQVKRCFQQHHGRMGVSAATLGWNLADIEAI